VSEQSDISCRSTASGPNGFEVPLGADTDVLESQLRRLVAAHLEVDPGRLVPEARLGQDLCIDSLAAVELTMVIEDEFDIALPEEVMADVRTYGDVLARVAERAGEHAN
jgi:acyl carrier protein